MTLVAIIGEIETWKADRQQDGGQERRARTKEFPTIYHKRVEYLFANWMQQTATDCFRALVVSRRASVLLPREP